MPQVDLLIFDLDGTLVDSRHDLTFAVNQTLRKFGLPPLSLQTVVAYVGDGVHNLMRRALGGSQPRDVEEAVQVFRRIYSEHLLDHSRLYPGIAEALDALQGRRKAVVTNKPMEFSDRILRGLGVRHLFALVLGGDAVEQMKPDPAPVLETLRRLCTPADRAVMIGDSRTDLTAGRNAGTRTCWVAWGFRGLDEIIDLQPDIIAREPSDLVRWFGKSPPNGK